MPIHLPHPTDEYRIFRGAPDSPFLAPRGVHLGGNRLLVSDTGHNRVFIWHQLPTQEFQSPDMVLGQSTASETERNRGSAVNATTLLYPSGLWSDGQKLIVADAWNHRVLVWHRFPTTSGQPADVVIGQADLTSNAPNQQGVGNHPTARTLHWPYGLTSDGTRLWIADTGNRRVLLYHTIPTEHNAPADALIGQENFGERDYDAQNAIWPYSVKISANGYLAITDTQYYRVLLWPRWENAFAQPATVLVGQPHREANGQNQFGLTPQAHTLNWCYDTCFDGKGFWVADTGNSRMLWFRQIPSVSNAAADALIGPSDFVTGSENSQTIHGTEQALYWPFSVDVSPNHLAIADTGNHRVILIHRTTSP